MRVLKATLYVALLFSVVVAEPAVAQKVNLKKPVMGESVNVRMTFNSVKSLGGWLFSITPNGSVLSGQVLVLRLKLENLSDQPLDFDPTKLGALDNTGRAYSALKPEAAAQRYIAATATVRQISESVANDVTYGRLGGPLRTPTSIDTSEKRETAMLTESALRSGTIPAKAYKEGHVFFEWIDRKAKPKPKELKIVFDDASTTIPIK